MAAWCHLSERRPALKLLRAASARHSFLVAVLAGLVPCLCGASSSLRPATALLAQASVPPATAAEDDTPDGDVPFEGHVLAVMWEPPAASAEGGGSLRSRGARANPTVDDWHASERKRVEAQCEEMLRELACEKRRRLQHITDQREQELSVELRRLAAAERAMEQKVATMEREQDEAIEEASKVPPREADIGVAEDVRCRWRRRVEELEEKIAEKKVCIKKLQESSCRLLDARRDLETARLRLQAKESEAAAAKANVSREEGHVSREQEDVGAAEDALASAKSRLSCAEARLRKAEADLAEHQATKGGDELDDAEQEDLEATSEEEEGARAAAAQSAPAEEEEHPKWAAREKSHDKVIRIEPHARGATAARRLPSAFAIALLALPAGFEFAAAIGGSVS